MKKARETVYSGKHIASNMMFTTTLLTVKQRGVVRSPTLANFHSVRKTTFAYVIPDIRAQRRLKNIFIHDLRTFLKILTSSSSGC